MWADGVEGGEKKEKEMYNKELAGRSAYRSPKSWETSIFPPVPLTTALLTPSSRGGCGTMG